MFNCMISLFMYVHRLFVEGLKCFEEYVVEVVPLTSSQNVTRGLMDSEEILKFVWFD